jgi:hypothetical protein
MRKIGLFLAIALFCSYLPMVPMDDCPEDDHLGNVMMNCGYSFHCPLISSITPLQPVAIPNIEPLVLIMPSLLVEDLEYPIFHPPEHFHQRGPSISADL